MNCSSRHFGILLFALLVALSCVRAAPNTLEEHARDFDQLRIGISPAAVRNLFPKLYRASQARVSEATVSEYRFQDGTMPRPGSLAPNFDRVPHYVYFYFVDEGLVEWGENRVRYESDPDIVIEWRRR